MRRSYALAANVRYQLWSDVVRGTRNASPWVAFLERHHTDPQDYPLERAKADFANQPRVLAMRSHNAVTYGGAQLDEWELEMFQAGPVAYQNFQAMSAMATDTVLTPTGERIIPACDRFADRLAFLTRANWFLDHDLDPDTRIVAVALTH
jgi:hypothetical protein